MPTDAGTVRVPAADPPTGSSAGVPAAEPSAADPSAGVPADPSTGAVAGGVRAAPAAGEPVAGEELADQPAALRRPVPSSGSSGKRSVPAIRIRSARRHRAKPQTGPRPPFPFGAAGYGLAWAAALTVGGAVIAFLEGSPSPEPTLKAVLGVAAVLTSAAVHLTALAIERRRQLGMAVVALALAVLVVPALTLGLLSVATGWGPGGSSTGGGAAVPYDDSGSEVLPTGGSSLPGAADTVWCAAEDGSMVVVDATACVDGRVKENGGGAG